VNRRDDILSFIADDRFKSNDDSKPAEFIREKERVGIGPSADQQFGADRNGFCDNLVHLICLVCLVYLFARLN
jgi:hypothetical protein